MDTTLKNLIERFRSKPDWQSPDPGVRADAVLRLPASERELILALAREDPESRVRRAAVKRITEATALAALLADEKDPAVRDEAEGRLAHLAVQEADEDAARGAVSSLRDPRHLAAVAKTAPQPGVREAAVRSLSDPRALSAIVREASDASTRMLALERIDDGGALLALALKSEHKGIAVAAVERLSDPEALRAVSEKARVGAASRRARARLDEVSGSAPASASPSTAFDGEDEEERRAYEEARRAQEREAGRRAEELRAWETLALALETAEGEAIPAAALRARGERAGLPRPPGPEVEALEARVEAALAAAPSRHAAYLAGVARREELAALAAQLEEASGLEDVAAARAAFSPLEARWREATTSADLPDLRARVAQATASLRAREQAVREEAHRRDQEHLQRLSALAEQAEQLLARGTEGSLRDSDHALREIREALEHPGHFPSRRERDEVLARLEVARKQLYPLVQQLREDAEWKRWANVTVQEELCARAEALVTEADTEKVAREMRELDARWKQAKEAPKDQAEGLWNRFKAARDQVKERADAFFAKQAEEMAANLARKESLCAQAEALADSTDWVKTADELRRLQSEWKETGPVPHAASRRTWERFRRPCDRFFTRWQEHRNQRSHEWADNLARKEALCSQAEALQDSTDWDKAAAELKRLQSEWRAVGAVKKSRSEVVWKRFRAACDHFFDRYKNRDEHARQAALVARETICAELEGLVPASGSEADAPADLPGRVQAAQTAWRQAGSLPQDQMAALDERFGRARDRLIESFPRAFEGTDLDPEVTRRKAEKLVLRVEGLLQELAPAASASSAQTAEELAARLRDALASNTIGGRAAVEERWASAANGVEAAQTAWRRLGPLTGAPGQALAERFEQACRRFAAERPRTPRAAGDGSRPKPGRGSRPRRA